VAIEGASRYASTTAELDLLQALFANSATICRTSARVRRSTVLAFFAVSIPAFQHERGSLDRWVGRTLTEGTQSRQLKKLPSKVNLHGTSVRRQVNHRLVLQRLHLAKDDSNAYQQFLPSCPVDL
jgi:hypothetical protein